MDEKRAKALTAWFRSKLTLDNPDSSKEEIAAAKKTYDVSSIALRLQDMQIRRGSISNKTSDRAKAILGLLAWTNIVTKIGGLTSSTWLVYLVYTTSGFIDAFFVFIGMSLAFKFGTAPMFAIAASVLCFRYSAVWIWLPIVSYVAAVILLIPALQALPSSTKQN
jgi:hypothetical protein